MRASLLAAIVLCIAQGCRPVLQSCLTDSECGDAGVCNALSYCERACESDRDCRWNCECKASGHCLTKTTGGACIAPSSLDGGCTLNTDCNSGSYCDSDTRSCVIDCRETLDCPFNCTCTQRLGMCVSATDGGHCRTQQATRSTRDAGADQDGGSSDGGQP